jgi:TatA/E family protein of Tat protein translocase
MFDISPVQIVIVLAIALLIFGPKRLPEMGRSMGKGLREFKDSISGSDKDDVFAIPTQLNDGTKNAVVAAPVHEDAKVA